jgi:predicted signal transduction protein with EAL and GGDEF domain
MKILLADDDAVTRTLLKRTLKRRGFDVICVADGQAAIDCLREDDGPRMAILDWEMPGKDGPTVCQEIRACATIPYVYLILLTSRETTEDIVTGFEAGADDYLIKHCTPEELKARIQVGTRSLKLQDSLIHEAEHDSLTGLPNRSYFVKRLGINVRKARELPDYRFTLLFIDIDRFKLINDSLGHLAGDELMKGVATRLLRAVGAEAASRSPQPSRDSNSGPVDLVARIGGDEFVILLENSVDAQDGVRVAKSIQLELEVPFVLNDHDVLVTASIGISTSGGETTESSEVLRAADAAMYKAKSLGKARYEVNDSKGNFAAVSLLKLESDLRRAVENREFEVHYQPIVSLADNRVLSFEALVRWRHPSRGLLQPASFISVAEDTGLIIPMGAQIMYEACRQVQEWNATLGLAHPLSVCVNVSPRQFGQDDLVKQVQNVLSQTGLDPTCLELEVTENLTMQDAGRAATLLRQLSHLGISISLDDFGTGYSSLSYLLRFPIQTLKIDRSFISDIEHSKESRAIVQTIIGLGHNLGMAVIAEGIETSAQMNLLKDLHCDLGQGYLFSRPVEAAKAAEMFAGYPVSIRQPQREKTRLAA